MGAQEQIIQNFKAAFGPIPLKEISRLTGIHMTRVFRLMNGYEMRLEESQKFINAIPRVKSEVELVDLARDCEQKLPSAIVGDIALLMRRRLRLSDLAVKNEGGQL